MCSASLTYQALELPTSERGIETLLLHYQVNGWIPVFRQGRTVILESFRDGVNGGGQKQRWLFPRKLSQHWDSSSVSRLLDRSVTIFTIVQEWGVHLKSGDAFEIIDTDTLLPWITGWVIRANLIKFKDLTHFHLRHTLAGYLVQRTEIGFISRERLNWALSLIYDELIEPETSLVVIKFYVTMAKAPPFIMVLDRYKAN